MYYLNEEQREAVRYFQGLESFTDAQADNAIKFCCSVCGCTREEQEHMLEWYFDGYAADLVHFSGDHGLFDRVLDYCGDAYIISPDNPEYNEYLEAIFDGYQVTGEVLPTGRLFVTNV